jgi:hypothetical protein
MHIEIEPCPWCGNIRGLTGSNVECVWVICIGCGATGPKTRKLDQATPAAADAVAVREWNRRTPVLEERAA